MIGQAKKAIEQALLEMFGTRRKADEAKRSIIEALQLTIKDFNANIANEFQTMMKDQKEKLRAELKEEFTKMRAEFMNELKNL